MNSPQEVVEQQKWRYATKIFDASKKIPTAEWKALEETLILTPSSYGLQPWKFLVVTDPAMRRTLQPLSWNQKQVVDASHYVIFLGRTDITASDVERFTDHTAQVRGVPKESQHAYRDMMIGDLVKGPRHAMIAEWAARQVYIALGNFMNAAAAMGIDTCPMEGIDPPKYDEALELKGTGFRTIVACAAGYRSADDKYARLPKVRYSADTLIRRI